MGYFIQIPPYKTTNAELAARVLVDEAERAERAAADWDSTTAEAIREMASEIRSAAAQVVRLRGDRDRALRLLEKRPWGDAVGKFARLLDEESEESVHEGIDGVEARAILALTRGACHGYWRA